jgi:transposase-like protein
MEQSAIKPTIRYSEAFKMQIVRELDSGHLSLGRAKQKYGIGGAMTVQRWVRQYGNGNHGKVVRVEQPQELNEKEQLKRRVRALEKALADANIDLVLERAYTKIACERAGIQDVEAFKKKHRGKQPT